MAGIGDKAAGGLENKKKYNGNELQSQEFSDGRGLEVFDFNARTYDLQTGRFMQIDPEAENEQESLTPYQFGTNNPIRYNDPDGKCPTCLIGAMIGAAVDYTSQVISNRLEGKDWNTSLTSINLKELAVSTLAGAASGGVSSLYKSAAVTGTKLLLTEGSFQAIVAGTTSVINQGNDNIDKGKSAMDISIPQVALDIATDHVSSKIAEKVVPATDLRPMERQADRTARIASNDPASSGRAANASAAKTNLTNARNANYTKQTLTSNIGSTATGKATGVTTTTNSTLPIYNISPSHTDATFVKKPILPSPFH